MTVQQRVFFIKFLLKNIKVAQNFTHHNVRKKQNRKLKCTDIISYKTIYNKLFIQNRLPSINLCFCVSGLLKSDAKPHSVNLKQNFGPSHFSFIA